MEKTFLLYLSVHWGDLIEQIKKICHIHFKVIQSSFVSAEFFISLPLVICREMQSVKHLLLHPLVLLGTFLSYSSSAWRWFP